MLAGQPVCQSVSQSNIRQRHISFPPRSFANDIEMDGPMQKQEYTIMHACMRACVRACLPACLHVWLGL